MNSLFQNAVESIQLGVEDYMSDDPRRAASSARNFFAGVLLLAKEALIRASPNADASVVLAARQKLLPDGDGGLTLKPVGKRTIDFADIGTRLQDFAIAIDHAALKALGKIRNEIEHYHTPNSRAAVRQAIAQAFPVVGQLFHAIGENPVSSLGVAWSTMLEVKAVFESELEACKRSFANIDWQTDYLAEVARLCPTCDSPLVYQRDATNTDPQSIVCECKACGATNSAEDLVTHSVEKHLDWESYLAATDGGEPPLHHCHECGVEAYVTVEEHNGCLWCTAVLDGKCGYCHTGLTPDNVSPNNSSVCARCDHILSKDD